MKFYAAGSMTRNGFVLLGPVGCKPYVWPASHPDGLDAAALRRMTKPYASLYAINPDGKTVILSLRGDQRATDPSVVILDVAQQTAVAEGVARATRELEAIGVPL